MVYFVGVALLLYVDLISYDKPIMVTIQNKHLTASAL